MELEMWLGPQKDEILQALESMMSLQFGRARQQLTNASLPPVQKEILRRLAHQMRTGEALPSKEIELKEVFTQPIWVRFQLAMEAESNRTWCVVKPYIEASWRKFQITLGYTPD